MFARHFRGMCNLWALFSAMHSTLRSAPSIEYTKTSYTSKNPTNFSITYFTIITLSYVFCICANEYQFSISLCELLILFAMHLKCLWINVLLMVGWWKFCSRIHAFQIETSTLMALMLNLFQTFQLHYTGNASCVCECVCVCQIGSPTP